MTEIWPFSPSVWYIKSMHLLLYRTVTPVFSVLILMLIAACAQGVIPKDLEPQVDRNVTFLQVKEAPMSYRGRTVVLGGEVLAVKRDPANTWIEILQLPLDGSLQPIEDRTKSLGRFLGVQQGMLDPATLPAGTRITIVGEIAGATPSSIDGMPYSYPTLTVKHIKPWEPRVQSGMAGTGIGIGIGGIFGGGRSGGFGGVGIGGGF
jgi:outer membrane lipoprotein